VNKVNALVDRTPRPASNTLIVILISSAHEMKSIRTFRLVRH